MRTPPPIAAFLAALTLAACASTSAGGSPAAAGAAGKATVVVLREKDPSDEPIEITVQGRQVARLLPNKWRRFTLDSGTHVIGAPGSEVSVTMLPRARYWFLVSSKLGESTVRRMDSTEAAARIADANHPRNSP